MCAACANLNRMGVSSPHEDASHVGITASMIEIRDQLVEAAGEALDSFGADAEEREQREIAEGSARREQLEAERGEDYHGFGNPPLDNTDR